MAAPKGNKFAKGNSGGGRKSAYDEHKMAEILKKAFLEGVDVEKLNNIHKQKELKLIDLVLLRAITSDSVLIALLKKLLPDKNLLGGDQHDPLFLPIQIISPKKKK